MTTVYPGNLDAFTNPVGTDEVDTVDHAAQHADKNDAVEALETYLGITGSADVTSITYILTNHTHTVAAHALDVDSGFHTGTLDSDDVVFAKEGTPVNFTLTDWFNIFGSVGVNDPTNNYVTNKDADEVTVAAGEGFIRTTDSDTGVLKFIEWPALDIVCSTTANAEEFIGIRYNAGTPEAYLSATFNFNWNNNFPLAKVFHDGTNRHIQTASAVAADTANKARRFLREVLPMSRTVGAEGGGLILSDVGAGSQDVAVSAGKIWHGFNEFDISAVNTAAPDNHTFRAYHRVTTGSPPTWVLETMGQWPNDEYDDGGADPQPTLGVNKYGVLWWYIDAEDGNLAMLFGRGEYNTSGMAQAEAVPNTTPGGLSDHARLLGRFIVQQGNATAVLVQNVADTAFATAGVTDHDSLSGVSTDDHHAQSHNLDSHSDVNSAAPNNLDVLTWDSTPGEWIPVAPGAIAHPDLATHDALGLSTDAELALHIDDVTDAHDASAISILDTAADFTATDVEAALAELQGRAETHAADADPHAGYLKESDMSVANATDLTDGGATVLHSHAGAAAHTIQDDNVAMTARTNLSFQDGFVVADDAGGDQTELDLDYGTTTELTDVTTGAEGAGVSVKVARADHAHHYTDAGGGGGMTLLWSSRLEISAGTQSRRIYVPTGSFTIDEIYFSLPVANTGTTLIDVHKNGTTVYTTQGNRPTLTAGIVSNRTVPDVTALTTGDYLECFIDQKGGAEGRVQVYIVTS
jgi:hypothetical protein